MQNQDKFCSKCGHPASQKPLSSNPAANGLHKPDAVNETGESAEEQFRRGFNIRMGIGYARDERKGVEWYIKAAERGHIRAQYNLGWCYKHGSGIEQDSAKAFQWWSKAADQGSSEAQGVVGWCYENGIGTERDLKKAITFYQKAGAHNKVMELENQFFNEAANKQNSSDVNASQAGTTSSAEAPNGKSCLVNLSLLLVIIIGAGIYIGLLFWKDDLLLKYFGDTTHSAKNTFDSFLWAPLFIGLSIFPALYLYKKTRKPESGEIEDILVIYNTVFALLWGFACTIAIFATLAPPFDITRIHVGQMLMFAGILFSNFLAFFSGSDRPGILLSLVVYSITGISCAMPYILEKYTVHIPHIIEVMYRYFD